MNLYSYEGPVLEFETVIISNWSGETRAVSENKARSNLIYQFKKRFKRIPATRISLPGKIILKEGD